MRVSKMTVYRLVHNGELPAVRVGRSFRCTPRPSTTCWRARTSTLAEQLARFPFTKAAQVGVRVKRSLESPPESLGSGVHGFSHQEAA